MKHQIYAFANAVLPCLVSFFIVRNAEFAMWCGIISACALIYRKICEKDEMTKAQLSSNDEDNLIKAMQDFRTMLECVGIEGTANLTVETDGTIDGVFAVNDKTAMHIKLEEDDCKKTISYRQEKRQ